MGVVVKRADLNTSGPKSNSLFFLLHLDEGMDRNEAYFGHHFTIYVNQTILLQTLYSDVLDYF